MENELKKFEEEISCIYYRVVNYNPIAFKENDEVYPKHELMKSELHLKNWCHRWNFRNGSLRLKHFESYLGNEVKDRYDIHVSHEIASP